MGNSINKCIHDKILDQHLSSSFIFSKQNMQSTQHYSENSIYDDKIFDISFFKTSQNLSPNILQYENLAEDDHVYNFIKESFENLEINRENDQKINYSFSMEINSKNINIDSILYLSKNLNKLKEEFSILELNLSDCKLDNEKSLILFNTIGEYSLLIKLNLNLSKNIIGYSGIKKLCNKIINFKELKSLNLDFSLNNEFSGNALEDLPYNLSKLIYLENLSLNFADIKLYYSDLLFFEFKDYFIKASEILVNFSINFSNNKLNCKILFHFFDGNNNFI